MILLIPIEIKIIPIAQIDPRLKTKEPISPVMTRPKSIIERPTTLGLDFKNLG
jgi:hypothetical protein